MADKKIKIDPTEFALAVVSGSNLNAADDVRASKDGLKRYLSAYLLIEEFNQLESGQFSLLKKSDLTLLVKALEGIKFD
ncbi:hypothetical protein [Latilactobacillus fuchuensis]|nr:hypothetical protein [Latilactobacillus fuchuensis]MCP8857054.1 hypothetical protein [Latilactobacillus fuchuensis]